MRTKARRPPSKALVLETNNLEGGQTTKVQAAVTLGRLLQHLRRQTFGLDALGEVVITHPGFSPPEQGALQQQAGRSLTFVQIPHGAGYYQAKNLGFDATRAEVVAFGDSDCWPDSRWLMELFAPFDDERARAKVVAGRTTYREDLLGAAATTIDFMYFHGPFGSPELTRNFYANNVAFRREVFADLRYQPIDGVYRGHCQVLGTRLRKAGIPILFQPAARTCHRFPDTLRELAKLRRHRGADAIALTPHLAKAWLPNRLGWVGRSPSSALITLGVRLGFSLHALGRQDMPPVRGVRKLACAGGILGLSALDAVGALEGLLGPARSQRDVSTEALSYHRDVDRLSIRPAP